MVEDSVDDTLLMAAELQARRLDPVFERVETAASMQAALEVHEWDLIICDYSMPHFGGPEALAIYQQKGPGHPLHQRLRHRGRGDRRGDDEGRRARLRHEGQAGPIGAGGKTRIGTPRRNGGTAGRPRPFRLTWPPLSNSATTPSSARRWTAPW